MKQIVINHFHIHGNYIVGDYIYGNMSKRFIEDITPADDSSSVASECHSDTPSYFPYLTRKCFQEKRVEAVEAEIRAACKGTAEALWRTLWNNENLGFVEVEHIDAATLYRGIGNWYGKLPYSERNFRKARNNR